MAYNVFEFSSQELVGLLSSLKTTLPYSLSLYRCIQRYQEKGDDVHVFATFAPRQQLPPSFAVGLFDYTSPGIQAYIFSSLQMMQPSGSAAPQESAGNDESRQHALDQLLSLFSAFRSRTPPTAFQGDGIEGIILVGTVHSEIAELLRAESSKNMIGLVRDDFFGRGGPYDKYVFRASESSNSDEETLPQGLHFDSVRNEDHNLIFENNDILKDSQNLFFLPHGVGIRSAETGTLAAWAFFAVDGSIRTLFVMPEYRKKRLGRKVAVRVMRQGLVAFGNLKGEGDHPWVQGDVASGNTPSVGLFRGLGGQRIQESYWMKVDLAKVPLQSQSNGTSR